MALDFLKITARALTVKPFYGPQVRMAASAGATTDVSALQFWQDNRSAGKGGARKITLVGFTPDPAATIDTNSTSNYWVVNIRKWKQGDTTGQILANGTGKVVSGAFWAAGKMSTLSFNGPASTTSAAIATTTGSAVSVQVVSSASFNVGDYVTIDTGTLAETLQISTIADSTHLSINIASTHASGVTISRADPAVLVPGDFLTYEAKHTGTPTNAFPAGLLAVDIDPS